MERRPKSQYDLSWLANQFGITRQVGCEALARWSLAQGELTPLQQTLFDTLCQEMKEEGDYWNEEELKIQFIGLLFRIADVNVKNKTKVFYERPLSATLQGISLSVVVDCLLAKPMEFNTPQEPYFFLQEFKKGKGEKKDPEAQMLVAMLIAQAKNASDAPVYGGFLVGSVWTFATLTGVAYCTSRKYDASQAGDLAQIVFMLRYLRDLPR
jgi:hypothetical protein